MTTRTAIEIVGLPRSYGDNAVLGQGTFAGQTVSYFVEREGANYVINTSAVLFAVSRKLTGQAQVYAADLALRAAGDSCRAPSLELVELLLKLPTS